MNGVEFDTEQQAMIKHMQARQQTSAASSKFATWLITKGIVKTDAAAQKVQIAIVILNVLITVWIVKSFVL